VSDRVFAFDGDWAVGSDGLQWILMRRETRKAGPFWNPVSFVRSDRDILARCMREKGVGEATARLLLAGLPDTFDQWKLSQSALEGATRRSK
jgi:hypothetical protein